MALLRLCFLLLQRRWFKFKEKTPRDRESPSQFIGTPTDDLKLSLLEPPNAGTVDILEIIGAKTTFPF